MANEARHPLEAYADSYAMIGRLGDGRVCCRSVEADIRQNMIPATVAATLASEQARDALTELDQLRHRVKELDKALEPFASENFDLFDNMPDDEQLAILSGGLQIAHCTVGDLRTARRVREGGKVDG